jgi:radical SAM superfamily enzyme YgiQ (UPF0313 family)
VKITLIKPTIGTKNHSLYVDEGRMEPLQLGVIAALLPKDIDVLMYDDRIEKIPFDEPTDAVMITVETYTAKRAYEIADEYMARKIPVIMGGLHAKLATDEIMGHCSCTISGDAENILPQVMEDLKNGCLQKLYTCGTANPPQGSSTMPPFLTRRDIFNDKGYLPISLVQFSRGCVNECNYCASSVYFNKKHRCRAIEDVIAEIKSQKRKFIFFVDDNLVADKEKAKALLRALIPLKITWVSQGTVNMVYDEELMELIVKSGGMGFVIGFESINSASIDFMGKTVNKERGFDTYKTAVALLKKWGLQTWAAFTIGHDTDTLESIKQTVDWALKNKFTFTAFNILMPYPQTPLYKKLQAEGRLLYDGKWWLHDEYRFNYASFVPKNMTPQELTEIAFYCRKKFNSPLSVLYRMFEPRTNMRTLKKLIIYWLYNPLFRREVYKKQGLQFGLKHFETREK